MLKRFYPGEYAASVFEIDYERLNADGKTAVYLDALGVFCKIETDNSAKTVKLTFTG